jgi:hypothetical protein
MSSAGLTQTLDAFLTWLVQVKGIELCECYLDEDREPDMRVWSPVPEQAEQLIVEFAGVDWANYQAEQEALLAEAGPAPDWQP